MRPRGRRFNEEGPTCPTVGDASRSTSPAAKWALGTSGRSRPALARATRDRSRALSEADRSWSAGGLPRDRGPLARALSAAAPAGGLLEGGFDLLQAAALRLGHHRLHEQER